MLEKKRRQHYVWRHYLDPWTIEEKVFWMNRDGKICSSNPRNLAVGVDFYTYDKLRSDEIKFLREFFFYEPLTCNWIKIMNNVFEQKEAHSNVNISNNQDNQDEDFDILINNNGEEIQTHFENMGRKYLDMLWDEETDFWVDEQSKSEFTFYLMIQYFRTKRQQDKIFGQNELFENENVRLNEIWKHMVIMLATNLVGTVVFGEEDWELIPLKNNTAIPFITGDQPVINLYEKDKKLVFYYPIKPDFSILLKKKSDEYQPIVDEKDVFFYNDGIADSCGMMIFGNSEEIENFISQNKRKSI